jgi:hypothetical protein
MASTRTPANEWASLAMCEFVVHCDLLAHHLLLWLTASAEIQKRCPSCIGSSIFCHQFATPFSSFSSFPSVFPDFSRTRALACCARVSGPTQQRRQTTRATNHHEINRPFGASCIAYARCLRARFWAGGHGARRAVGAFRWEAGILPAMVPGFRLFIFVGFRMVLQTSSSR